MKKRIYEIEIERNDVTPKQFYNYCKKQLAKKGQELFIESFEDFENPLVKLERQRHEDGCITCVIPYTYQMYCPKTYNFIMEFSFWDEKKGYGYLYAVEYEQA